MKGTIAGKNDEKGFGFITPEGKTDEKGNNVFFHTTALVDGTVFTDLQKGDLVEYEEEASDKGPRAVNVHKVMA
jgi:CspA family cold shock protein